MDCSEEKSINYFAEEERIWTFLINCDVGRSYKAKKNRICLITEIIKAEKSINQTIFYLIRVNLDQKSLFKLFKYIATRWNSKKLWKIFNSPIKQNICTLKTKTGISMKCAKANTLIRLFIYQLFTSMCQWKIYSSN